MQSIPSPFTNSMTGTIIEVECHLSNGLPSVTIIGFANKALDEARERIRSAFSSSGLPFPKKRIVINLAPADMPKDSTSFDVPVAVAILVSSGLTSLSLPDDTCFLGEVGLDGTIRPVRGVIGKIIIGKKHGFNNFVLPQGNLEQASMVPGISLLPIESLQDLYKLLSNSSDFNSTTTGTGLQPSNNLSHSVLSTTLDDIVGQDDAKRAIEVAAAGNHNILLHGPPGTGKSMLANALHSLLPPMSHDEITEVTHIHSLASMSYEKTVLTRPHRKPHHHASNVAITGGGAPIRPGEIALSHRGVLFFDELPEFSRSTIESLRQPLEEKIIRITRSKESVEFPASFIFVATANPCPCGYFGSSKSCSCSAYSIRQYQQKLSGPIIDRIDIHTHVGEVDYRRLLGKSQYRRNNHLAKRIHDARTIQTKRFGSTTKYNSDMSNEDIQAFCNISDPAKALLTSASEKLQISARAYMKTVKLAQTIADLEQNTQISTNHIAEALQFRNTISGS